MINLGFLASGEGTSVEFLTKKIRDGSLTGFEPKIILSNREKGTANVYKRAERLGIECLCVYSSREQLKKFQENDVELVLSLGYTGLIGKELIEFYTPRIWNIHPSLLPRHGGKGMYGLAVHKSVLKSHDNETGATIHIVTQDYDSGPILNKVIIPVMKKETAEQLQKRVLAFEHILLETTLNLYKEGLLQNCPRPFS